MKNSEQIRDWRYFILPALSGISQTQRKPGATGASLTARV